MSIVKLLYIDDNRINSQIESLRKKLKKQKGLELQEQFLNLGLDEFKKRDKEHKTVLDDKKIKSHIKETFFNENFDIVISDYDFKDEKVDGYKLISWIKNVSNSEKARIRRAKFCLYSAQQDKVVQIFDSPEKIKKLVKLNLDDFIDRTRLPDELISIINKNENHFNFSETIIKFLNKYPEYKFNSVYPRFKGKELSEISNEIEKDLPNGIDFQKDLVELTIAHLIALNKYEK